jgi:fructuronate reductase
MKQHPDVAPLGPATLAALPPEVARPAYPPEAAAIGVVHLGVGNFFRAHQAVYLDEAMNRGATGWGVCGVSLRAPGTRDALAPQDGYYSLIERDGDATRVRVIGSLRELLVAREDPGPVIGRIAGADTRWVTLTITEKGYGNAAGRLDPAHPDVAHDLVHPDRPRSAVGLLHAAVVRRRGLHRGGLTVLSCDNLSCNGDLLRALLLEFDAALEAGMADWIADHLRFPNTMVDRIVPRTDEAQRALARQLLGVADAWPVVTEPFRQWVIEDRFAGPRPRLEESGVQIVADVRPFEAMKLRLLNAAHSALAWLAVPAGLATVDRAIAEPPLRRFIEALWRDEVIPGLDPEVIGAAPGYCAGLLARFDNAGLAHLTAQIAMDGSQKLPLRVLPSIRANLARGLPIDRLALVVAAWIRYLAGVDEQGRPYLPDDPLRERLQPLASHPDSGDAVRGILSQRSIFGELGADPALADQVRIRLGQLRRLGSRGLDSIVSAT